MAAENKHTLYVSDLDGTLLNADAKLSESSAQLINDAIDAGAAFTIATARTPATVQPLLNAVRFSLPGIVLTGAAWWHFDTQTYSNLQFISGDYVRILIDIFNVSGITPFIYTLATDITPNLLHVYYNNVCPTSVDATFIDLRQNLPLKKFHIGASLPYEKSTSTLLFFATGPKELLTEIAGQVERLTTCAFSCYDDIYNPGVGIIEIFAPGVSKAAAIQQMCRHYGFERLTVFGDNLNDLSMFAIADTSVAVANASETVRNAATQVIGANTSDAVGRYILDDLTK